MLFISQAYAAAGETVEAATGQAAQTWDAFAWNMGLVLLLVVLFYVLLIMPQQRRFKEHRAMLDSLKKGDEVVTGGGLIGKIDKVKDENEVVIDIGGGVKVTALRSTIQNRGGLMAATTASRSGSGKDKKGS